MMLMTIFFQLIFYAVLQHFLIFNLFLLYFDDMRKEKKRKKLIKKYFLK
jgi:hypothetical protein